MQHKFTVFKILYLFMYFLAITMVGQTMYYVNGTSGTDDTALGRGTAEGPVAWKTIQYAIDNVLAGDIIQVSAGTYTENIIINKPLTLNGANTNIPYGIDRVSESILQPFTPGSAPISLGAGYDNVTINGFEITAPMSTNAIYCGVDGPSHLDIKFNYIHDIGTGNPGGNVYAINYRGGANNTTDINISDNFINEVFSSVISANKSSAAIWLGQSTATGTVSNVTIERNTISNVKSDIDNKVFESSPYTDVGKYTASGIYIGIGWKNTGNVSGAIILDNTITDIIGGIAYGVQLSGNTPGLNIQNNVFDNVSSPGSPSYSYDVGITSTNHGSATISVNNNSFSTVSYGVANSSGNLIDATENWWGNASGPSNASNKYIAVNTTGQVAVSNDVTFVPWLDLDGGSSFAPVVNTTQGTNFASIQSAVDAASTGDVIEVAAGTYTENVNITVGVTLQSTDVASTTIITGNLTIAADAVTIDGFTITNPSGKNAILVTDYSHISIKNNIINDIGSTDNTTSGTNIGIMVVSSLSLVDDIVIENNTISNITGGNFKSADAIAIGWSNGNQNITNLLIENNTISNITSSILDFALGGRGTYGMLLNHGSNGTGEIVSPQILNNTISNLEGLWAHGIGLEGNTPNALVQGNVIYDLIDHKTPTDAAAIMVEDNSNATTVIIKHNSFYNTLLGVRNATNLAVTAEYNWWGDTDPSDNILNTGTGSIDFTPWLNTGTDADNVTEGFQGDLSDLAVDDSDPDAIIDILSSVPSGGTLTVSPGTYNAFNLTNSINLVGNGAIINNGSPAITVNATNVTITGFTFVFDAYFYAIAVQNGAYDVTITNCNFKNLNGSGLVGFGVINRGTGVVNAIDNYWGDASGPKIASNPSGVGVTISNASTGTLLYSPWWVDDTHTSRAGFPPTLIKPVQGLTGVSVEPTLSWEGITNSAASSYILYIDDNPDCLSPFYSKDQGLLLTNSLTELTSGFPLDNNKTYYWKVAAVFNGVEFDSDIYHFTTVPSVPITLSLPNNNETVNMTDVTFYYYVYGTFGNMQYKIQVEEDAGSVPTAAEWANVVANHDFESITTVGNKLFTLHEGTKYYWRVILLDENDGVINYSAVRNFTTGGGASVTPILSWPLSITVFTNTPTLYWYTSPQYYGNAEFQARYATSNSVDGNGELNDGSPFNYPTDMAANGSSALYLTLPTLSAGATYYWQVRTYDPITLAYGPWSSVGNFATHGTGTLLKPTLSYPVGNVTVYTTAPTLYWYVGGLGEGLTYDVYYAEDGQSYNVVPLNSDADLSCQLTGLEAGKKYNWYVKSNNNTATMASDVSSFTITGGVDNGHPVITWPVANPTVYTTKPTIYWFIEGSSLGISDVKLVYNEGSSTIDGTVGVGVAVPILIPLPDLSYTLSTDLTPGSKYYFALASFDGTNYSDWVEDAFTVYDASTNISDPVLVTPIGGLSLASDSPTLYWYVVGDLTAIDYYEVTYSKSDVWESTATTVATSVNSNLALSNLTPGATYYWKVRSHYTNGSFSNSSGVETFVINPGGNAIQPLVGGPNNVVVNTTAPTISWVFPAEHSSTLKSELLISDNSDMINATTIADITNSNYDVSGLEKGKLYFWRVRTKTTDNTYSEFSGLGTFKVGDNVTAVEEPVIIPEKFSVSQNYPNPFNPSTVINYALPKAEFVTIRIYNMLGQEIVTLLNEEVNAGVYNISWNGIDNSGVKVATGSYIYRVVAGNNVVTKKMILLK